MKASSFARKVLVRKLKTQRSSKKCILTIRSNKLAKKGSVMGNLGKNLI